MSEHPADDEDTSPPDSGEEWKRNQEAKDAAEDTSDADHPLKRDGRYLRQFAIDLGKLLVAGRKADYDIGSVVDEAMRGRYWERWPVPEGRTPSFAVWCDQVLGFRSRKAEYLRHNFLALKALNLPEDTLYRALRVGWGKLALVLRVAKSEMMLIQWIDRIEKFKLNIEEVESEVKQATASPGSDGDESDEKGEAGDGTAPGDDEPPSRRPKETIIFEDVDDLRIWTKVRSVVKERMGVTGKGRILGILATEYLAALPKASEGGVQMELAYIVQHLERVFGVKLGIVSGSVPVAQSSAPTPPPLPALPPTPMAAPTPPRSASDRTALDV